MLTNYLTYFLARLNLRDEEGQTAVEYALVIVLVSLVIAAALALGITGLFTDFWIKVESAID